MMAFVGKMSLLSAPKALSKSRLIIRIRNFLWTRSYKPLLDAVFLVASSPFLICCAVELPCARLLVDSCRFLLLPCCCLSQVCLCWQGLIVFCSSCFSILVAKVMAWEISYSCHILQCDCIFLTLRYLSFDYEYLGSLEKLRQGASYCSHWPSFCSCTTCACWSNFDGRRLITLNNDRYDWISLFVLSCNRSCLFNYLQEEDREKLFEAKLQQIEVKFSLWIICYHS